MPRVVPAPIAAPIADVDLVQRVRPIWDAAGRIVDAEIVFASAAWRATFARGEDVTGRRLLEVQPNFGDERIAAIARCAETGEVQRLATRHPTQPGRHAVIQLTPMDGDVLAVAREALAEDLLRERLRESDARFRRALDASPDTIAIMRPLLDADGRFHDVEPLFLNRASLERWFDGHTEADLAGKPLFANWPLVGRQLFDIYRSVVEDAATFHQTRHFVRPDGRELWADLYVALTPDGIVHTSRDVTEAYKAAGELKLAQQRFATVVANAREAISISSPVRDPEGMLVDLRIEWVNPAWGQVFGLGDHNPVGLGAYELRPELGALRAVHEAVLADGESRRVEHQLTTGRWLSIDFSRLGTDQLMAVSRDVTEERSQEIATRLRLAAAIEHTSESVVITDTDGNIQYVNPAFEAVTGYSRAEVEGRNPRILTSVHVEPAVHEDLWRTITAGQAWRGELVNRRKTGELFTEEASISPVLGLDGRPTAFVAVKRDVTAQRGMEAHLRQAQRLESVGLLAGGVAHDFNNILAAIRGYGEMVREALAPGSPEQADIDQVLLAADRAAALIRQLLAFSRRQPLSPRPVQPTAVVDALLPMLRRLVGEHIALATAWTGNPTVVVDPGQLEQVVLNLVVNARDAMPMGGTVRLAIDEVDVVRPGTDEVVHVVRLEVSDTGSGMDASVLAHIFDPYFSTKETSKGTGLGLATVYGIVTASGGWIRVASTPGAGSTFTVELPACEAGDHPLPERSGLRAGVATEAAVILVTEDDPAVRQVVARALRGAGHTVHEAESGTTALALLDALPHLDLLITDVRMPGMQGPELVRHVLEARPGTRVLYMSGFSAELLDAGASAAGLAGITVLDKPFTVDTLIAAVRASLAGSPSVG